MATRSFIIVKENDSSYSGIYCHNDGYIDGVGSTLIQHYQTVDDVNQLVSLGNLSSLGDNLKSCTAYIRDRGEDVETNKAFNVSSFNDCLSFGGSDIEYYYLFDNGQWFVTKGKGKELKTFEEFKKDQLRFY